MSNVNLAMQGADPVALKEYIATFGQGTKVKMAACVAAAQTVNWYGMAHSTLVPLARAYFDKKAAEANAVYQEACVTPLADYEHTRCEAMEAHGQRVAPSLQAFEDHREQEHAKLQSKDPRHLPVGAKISITKAYDVHAAIHDPSHAEYTRIWEAAWVKFTEDTKPAREALGVAVATAYCDAANLEITALLQA